MKLSKVLPGIPQVFSVDELKKLLGGQPQILKYKKTGKVIALGSGFYCTPGTTDFEARVLVVAKYYPNAVISGLAALKLHGLIDSLPSEIEADIPRTTNIKNNLIHFRRIAKTRMIGIGTCKLQGGIVKVYDIERSIADLTRLDFDEKTINQCWRRYIQRAEVKTGKLKLYGKTLGIDLLQIFEHHRLSKEYLPQEAENEGPDLVLEAAINAYCEKGAAGLTFEDVAEKAGIPASKVIRRFKNKQNLIQAVYDALERKLDQSWGQDINAVQLSPRQFATVLTQAALKMAEADPVSSRIQKWTIAENSPYSRKIIRVLVSSCINNLATKICEEIPQITYPEAEARAYLLAATYDHYNYLGIMSIIWKSKHKSLIS